MMRRVMIVGQPGSGKSTLARRLGSLTGLPVYHVDHIHWMAGWVERPRPEKTTLCRAIHAREQWIFEGGHSATWPERLARCDTLIWLDLPVHTRLRRVLFRSVRYRGRTRPDLPDGCPERVDPAFLRYIWDTRRTGRRRMARLVAGAPAETRTAVLRSAAEVEAFLKGLSAV